MSSYGKAKARYESKQQSTDEDAPREKPTFRCAAEGCPMAGAIFAGPKGWCAYHHAAHARDIPRITSVLQQHSILRDVIVDGRCLIVDPEVEEWQHGGEMLKLAARVLHAGYEDMPSTSGQTLRSWLHQLEVRLGGIVVQAMGVRPKERPHPTRQQEMAT